MATNFYSSVTSLTPDSSEILEAELLVKQILEAQYPDMDFREGTGIRDLVVRPAAFAYALLKKANDYHFTQNTLVGVTDASPSSMIDDILSNWFITRKTGSYSVINARLYFSRVKTITLPSTVWFSTDNSLRFYPQSAAVYPPAALSYDANQNEWYLDVDLIAGSTGTDYNLGSGSLLYFSSFDPYFLHAEINYLVSESSNAETNTEFIKRSESAISTRNLINTRSIDFQLKDVFNYMDRIVSVGFGSPDMYRDMVKAVFDPEDPRRVVSMVKVSPNLVTVALAEHGFNPGQVLTFSNGAPAEYLGQGTVITVLSTGVFTCSLPNVSAETGPVTMMPQVQSYTSPTYIHQGGKVDVYCDSSTSSSIEQIVLDSSGVGTISGAVIDLTRSPTSGGVEEDTVPLTIAINCTNPSLSGQVLSFSSTDSAKLYIGKPLNAAGLSQKLSISSITCSSRIATLTVANHGFPIGSSVQVEVSGVTPSGYNGVYSAYITGTSSMYVQLAYNVFENGSGTMLLSNPIANQDFNVTSLSPLRATGRNLWTAPGVITNLSQLSLSIAVEYMLLRKDLRTLSGVSYLSDVEHTSFTYQNHGVMVGKYLSVSLDGLSWQVAKVVSATNHAFQVRAISGFASGTCYVKLQETSKDLGFSDRGELYADFGTAYANHTASFEVERFSHIGSIQAYLDRDDVKIVCADYLARGFNYYKVDISLVSYDLAAVDSSKISSGLDTLFAGMAAGEALAVSEITEVIVNAGISKFQTPVGVTATLYHRDHPQYLPGTFNQSVQVLDYLDPFDNTCVFVLGNVSIEYVSQG